MRVFVIFSPHLNPRYTVFPGNYYLNQLELGTSLDLSTSTLQTLITLRLAPNYKRTVTHSQSNQQQSGLKLQVFLSLFTITSYSRKLSLKLNNWIVLNSCFKALDVFVLNPKNWLQKVMLYKHRLPYIGLRAWL